MRVSPGTLQFLEDGNIIKYNPYINTPERVKLQKYIIKGMTKLFKNLAIYYEKRQEEKRIRILNNRGKGYYINAKFYAPATVNSKYRDTI